MHLVFLLLYIYLLFCRDGEWTREHFLLVLFSGGVLCLSILFILCFVSIQIEDIIIYYVILYFILYYIIYIFFL